jgi:hypothetical protein
MLTARTLSDPGDASPLNAAIERTLQEVRQNPEILPDLLAAQAFVAFMALSAAALTRADAVAATAGDVDAARGRLTQELLGILVTIEGRTF